MKRWKRVVSFILALILCGGALGALPDRWGESAGASKAKINSIKNQVSQVNGQIKDIQSKLDAVKDDKAQALLQKQYLDEQIALSDQRIAQLDEILQAYDEAIAERLQEINDLQAREDAQYELFCQRVRSMEEQGTISYLSILFNAASFSELLDNVMLVGEIMEYDNEVIEVLQTTRRQVEEAKAELEAEQAEQQAAREEEAAAREELAAQEEAAAQLVREIATRESEYQAAIQQKQNEMAQLDRDMKKAQQEYEAELRRQEELRQQQNAATSIVSEKGFLWPLRGYLTLTSKFGWRTSPITGRSEYHLGTDIPAPRNTPILASKSGKVTKSAYHYSYGNYVVVTHSDGYQTLYAHMTSRAVSVGQMVTQGQVIGYVGTTGDSTGNHLHFEIWKDGARTNAESYFDLPFIRRY